MERPPEGTILRMLDPVERYFWFFDRLEPQSAAAIAELDVTPDLADVRRALDELQQRHPLLRAGIVAHEDGLAFVADSDPISLRVTRSSAAWTEVVADEMDTAFAVERGSLTRCVLVPAEDGTSVLAFIVHHCVVDGRCVLAMMQDFVRRIAEPREVVVLETPPTLHERFPEALRSPRAAISVVNAMRSERAGLEASSAFAGFDRDAVPRRTRLDRMVLDPDAVARLRAEARAAGSGPQGMVASAALRAVAGLLDDGDGDEGGDRSRRVVSLLTPTDLRSRVEPEISEDVVMVAIGLLATPYGLHVGADDGLAARITEQTKREIDRGESHLAYRLARAASFAPSDDGVSAFAQALARTPRNVAVSNCGLLDPGGDPPWVRSLHATIGPSPSQVVFFAATTYRGWMVINVTTDTAKLAEPSRRQVIDYAAAALGATPVDDPAAQSVRRGSDS